MDSDPTPIASMAVETAGGDGVPLLAVRDLVVVQRTVTGDTPILRGISLSIMRGEILGVVGQIRCWQVDGWDGDGTDLLDPPLVMTGGEIRFRGQRIDTLGSEDRRALRGAQIATIFQDPMTSLNPVFTVERQLVETITFHGVLTGRDARDEAVSLLARVGIPAAAERLRSYPHEFSGGMRQRVVHRRRARGAGPV